MREILFRGKVNDTKEWLMGDLISHTYEKPNIRPVGRLDSYIVIPETVGQYTGLTDKNGKKIFEGDIIQNNIGRIEVVEFYRGRYYPFIAFPEYNCWAEDECEVIGNMHDNPELMKGQGNG